jgi:hypothetical protein
MWGALQNPEHVEFYKRWHAGRMSDDQDFMPMVRAVQHLQSLPAASSLYAFTSVLQFHITTAPTFEECERHCSVTIVWQLIDRRFHIAFGWLADGWLEDRPPEQICEESRFAVVIEPFIQRLLASQVLSSNCEYATDKEDFRKPLRDELEEFKRKYARQASNSHDVTLLHAKESSYLRLWRWIFSK